MIFVGNLDPSVNEMTLKSFFSQYGNVLNVNIRKDLFLNRSKGFGYVTFENQEQA